MTDHGRFIAQRTIVEGHQRLEHVRFTAERIVNGIFDAMFQQVQDPVAFVFVVDVGTVAEFSEERNMHQIDVRLIEEKSSDGAIDLRFWTIRSSSDGVGRRAPLLFTWMCEEIDQFPIGLLNALFE